ncbi:hypothetical protein CGCF415_v006698 [Colletotrichum fructicola]|nr:hypothetical protein CGCFRS4_v007362 [Colletotrichum fructicola]KAF4908334.1 hypothetical protein CGCF415_v006698 [Colletotrichum fructicola]KAF4932772.1 hypothetical protein CGCF245_v010236 [Colletotrichum fructicola]
MQGSNRKTENQDIPRTCTSRWWEIFTSRPISSIHPVHFILAVPSTRQPQPPNPESDSCSSKFLTRLVQLLLIVDGLSVPGHVAAAAEAAASNSKQQQNTLGCMAAATQQQIILQYLSYKAEDAKTKTP